MPKHREHGQVGQGAQAEGRGRIHAQREGQAPPAEVEGEALARETQGGQGRQRQPPGTEAPQHQPTGQPQAQKDRREFAQPLGRQDPRRGLAQLQQGQRTRRQRPQG